MPPLVENSFCLDINALKREGWLATGVRTRTFTRQDDDGPHVLRLTFDIVGSAGSIRVECDNSLVQTIGLVRRTDSRDRTRWFFEVGDESFHKAYLHGGVFASRKAHGLRYVQECLTNSARQLLLMERQEQKELARADLFDSDAVQSYYEPNGDGPDLRAILTAQFVHRLDRTRVSGARRRAQFARLLGLATRNQGRKPRRYPQLHETQLDVILRKEPHADPEILQYHPRGDDGRDVEDGAHLQINVMRRLGWLRSGELTVTHMGWAEPWDEAPERDIDLVVDLRDPVTGQAVLILREGGVIRAQYFPIRLLPGDFGKFDPRFVCSETGRASRYLLFNQSQFTVPAAVTKG